jgi:outer membrane protein TolC
VNVRARIAPLVVASVLAASAAAAQSASEARLQELVSLAAANVAVVQVAPGQSPPAAGPSVASADLTVDEAVARALERNLDIAVERINPQTFDYSLAAIYGNYQPVVNSTLLRSYVVQLPTSQLIGGQKVENQSGSANLGGTWNLPWYGGSLALGWNNRRQESTNLFTTYSPQFNTSVAFGYAQPLLRNLRIDGTRQQLAVTRLNRDISETQLRATITNTLASVRNAYWDLVAARQAIDVAQRSLALAEKLVEDNKIRVEVGALAPIDVYQAQSEAASRRQTLATAVSTANTAELALKRLIVSGTEDPLWGASLRPVDRPDWSPIDLDVMAAVRKALDVRTDMAQARKQIDVSDVNVRYLKDQILPTLDLSAGYGLQGIGGTRYSQGQVVSAGGYGDAWDLMWQRDYPQWSASVTFSYPLGTSSAEAGLARAKLQLTQAQTQLRQLELQVATEVTTIASQITSNRERVDAATAARELAEKRLEAEQSKFEVGMSTNFFVVQAQRDLFDAQLVELRARLDYQKSLVDFDRVQQSSLSRPSLTSVTVVGGSGATVARTTTTTGGQ